MAPPGKVTLHKLRKRICEATQPVTGDSAGRFGGGTYKGALIEPQVIGVNPQAILERGGRSNTCRHSPRPGRRQLPCRTPDHSSQKVS